MTINLDEIEDLLQERLKIRGFLVDSDARCLEFIPRIRELEAENARLREALTGKENPEYEAKAKAAHDAIRAEVGPVDPAETLKMIETWKGDAEPANEHGQVSFSRAMLDSAEDALRDLLRDQEGKIVRTAQVTREMLARFVEQGGDHVTAASIRANWVPSWGKDPGKWDGPIPDDIWSVA
jgi:predicted nuclease with TOPRIM domain